jgi:vacuolar-type H+-ATPase subunit H
MNSWSPDTWLAAIAILIGLIGAVGGAAAFYFRSTAKDEIDEAIKASRDEIDKVIKEAQDEDDKVSASQVLATSRIRDQVIDHDRRIIKIENKLDALPSKDDLHGVNITVEKILGELKVMNVRMDDFGKSSTANGAKLDRLEQHIYTREGERS